MADPVPPPQPDWQALSDNIGKLTIAVNNMGKTAGDTSQSFYNLNLGTGKLFGSFGGLIESTTKGQTGMTIYNSLIDQTGDSLKKLLPETTLFGVGVGAMSDAARAYVKVTGAQTQELMNTYQGLAKVGAAGEADLGKVYEDMRKFGVTSAAELPKFTNLISQNSETLAKFGGTVSQGMKLFGDVAANIQQTGLQTQFLNMGMTVDSINAGMAGYLKLQTQSGAVMQRTGETQKQYTDRLSEGAADYLKNLDTLSKLTGKSGEALQKEREERMKDEAWALHSRELKQKAAAGDEAAKKQLEEEDKVLSNTQGDVNKGFRAMFAGIGAQTEEGRRLMQAAPEAARKAAEGVTDGAELLDTAVGEMTTTMNNNQKVIQLGNKTFTNSVDAIALEIKRQAGSFKDQFAAAENQQKGQIDKPDVSVAAQTELLQIQRQTATNLSDMSKEGIVPVTGMMIELAKKGRALTDILPGSRYEEEKDKPIRTDRGGGGNVGIPRNSPGFPPDVARNLPGGVADETIKQAAKEQGAALTTKVKDALSKLGDTVTDEVIDTMKEYLKGITTARPPPAAAPAPAYNAAKDSQAANVAPAAAPAAAPPAGPRGFSEPTSSTSRAGGTNLLANISQGVINIASANNIRFPNMSTRYNQNMSADTSKINRGSEKTSAETTTETTTNQDVVASNALLAAKMDDLIGLMRTSNGYQQKISQQVYA